LADRFYGIALGGQMPKDVTEAASTTSLAIELRINDTVYSQKAAVEMAIIALKNYITTREGNPIG
jgi:hypothetical protein